MAVLDRVRTKPKNTAEPGRRPATVAAPAPIAVVSSVDGAADQERPPHLPELAEGQLEADDEEQQDDADLRQHVDGLAVGDQAGARGADHQAGEQQRGQWRHPQPVAREQHRHGGAEHHDRLVQEVIDVHAGIISGVAGVRPPERL